MSIVCIFEHFFSRLLSNDLRGEVLLMRRGDGLPHGRASAASEIDLAPVLAHDGVDGRNVGRSPPPLRQELKDRLPHEDDALRSRTSPSVRTRLLQPRLQAVRHQVTTSPREPLTRY